ncbi:hypothetical protein B0T19DRAFT_459621 [Cercophora scortea]|uniref:Uncharacterized protein n=1 Tax=Cercophora scortea TaxID=314031 RepID=A0AAE0MIP3_9PEZI|nr:hypothetical protein B0T19DRAFT_459621 [Cercophora scortea]
MDAPSATKVQDEKAEQPVKRPRDSEGYQHQVQSPKRARLTRENLRLLNKMTRSGSGVSPTASTTTNGFKAQAAKNGILDPISSKPYENLRDSVERLNQSRETASPPESVYQDYLDMVGSVPNALSLMIEMTPLLKEYKDRGYSRAFGQRFTAYPKNVGFNNDMSAPQPDFVQGLRQQEFRPLPITDELDSAILFEDDRHSLALPHIAGEWTERGKNMEEESAYAEAALVHSRNEALAYIGEPDPPGHAAVTTFTTDGTTLNFFGHFAAESDGQLEYHQYPISTVNLKGSYEDFKRGRRQLRNAQDYAREQSYQLRDRLKEHWKARPAQTSGSILLTVDPRVLVAESIQHGEEATENTTSH